MLLLLSWDLHVDATGMADFHIISKLSGKCYASDPVFLHGFASLL